jgi:hypothetical protein
MGLLSFLFTSIAGLFVVGFAFMLIDVATEVAPENAIVQSSTSDVTQGVSTLSYKPSPEQLTLAAIVFTVLLLFYAVIKFYNGKRAVNEEG